MISTPALLGVTALVLVLLAMIFPRDALIRRITVPEPAPRDDALAAQYGAGVLRAAPEHEPLRAAVAERQVDVGKLDLARATLAPLRASPDASVRRDAGRREHAILTDMLAAAAPDSPEARQALADLRQLLDQLAQEAWPTEQMLAFAREAVMRGWPEIASRFYRRVGEVRHELAPATVREVVDHFVGRGDYRTGADVRFFRAQLARTLPERREHYLAGLAVLEAANRPREAVAVGRAQLGELIDDDASRAALVRLAVAAGDADTASSLHFAAQKRAPSLALRRTRFIDGVGALQSANRLGDALGAADANIGDLADDEATLLFLTRLAVTANDPVRAQAYARRLVRLKPLASVRPREAPHERIAANAPGATVFAWLAGAFVRDAHAQTAAELGARPYSEAAYRLAFDVFVANANFADARRVAEAALAQRAGDAAWTERLARVCEWMGDAPEALRRWRALAEQGDANAVQALLRLAPGLGDDDALLFAWLRVARTRALAAAEQRDVADLFERTNRVDEGIDWLRARVGPSGSIDTLALLGQLAARGGRSDVAIDAYETIAARGGLTVDHAMSLATLRFSRGDFARAFQTLERVRDKAAADDFAYWHLLGDLAWQLGDDASAAMAYERLATGRRLERFELARLLRLMRTRQPLEAARLAESAWRESRDPQLFYVAAEIYSARRDPVALTRLFNSVELADEPRFRNDAYFFTLRASWHAQRLRGREAINDFKRALALRPGDAALRSQYLWLAIDVRELTELRASLAAWEREARRDRTLWPVYAAGYQTLGEPRRALAYYRRALPDRRDDYLWLLGYADALADANEGGMAWRVRRHAWHAIRARAQVNPHLLRLPEEMVGYARLATQFAPGDASLRVVRQAISQSPVASGNAALDAGTRELALGYAIGNAEFDRARAWLWLQYGRALARPGWAELAVALGTNDLDALDRLIAADPRGLPRYDRIDSARRLERTRLAQSLAWESQESFPSDDEIHARLEPDLRATTPSVIAQATGFRYPSLRGVEGALALDYFPTPSLRLSPYVRETSQRSIDDAAFVNVPSTDRRTGLVAEWRTRERQVSVDLAERSAMRTFGSAALAWNERVSTRVGLRLAAGYNQFASETVALRIAGVKDEARAGLTWQIARREYLRADLSNARYETQARTFVGSGTRAEIEAGHRLRTDYPDLVARVYAGYQWFSRAGATDSLAQRINPAGTIPEGGFFLPPSFAFYAAAIGFGQALRETYTRAVRPFADATVSYNTVIGGGYGVVAGVAGSVLGSDHLALGVSRSRGGATANTNYTEVFLRYRLHF